MLSGDAPAHPALSGKVIANVSKVSGDPSTRTATLYRGGIAPDVKLVNVRVLGADGTGWTSDVIAGIEWVIQNREK